MIIFLLLVIVAILLFGSVAVKNAAVTIICWGFAILLLIYPAVKLMNWMMENPESFIVVFALLCVAFPFAVANDMKKSNKKRKPK